jgi:hypothetical protein
MINLPDGSDSFLTTRELCQDVLHIHRATLARWKRLGQAPSDGSFLLGRERYWSKVAVNEWLLFQQAAAVVVKDVTND